MNSTRPNQSLNELKAADHVNVDLLLLKLIRVYIPNSLHYLFWNEFIYWFANAKYDAH